MESDIRREKGAEKPLSLLFQLKVVQPIPFRLQRDKYGSVGSHVGKAPLHGDVRRNSMNDTPIDYWVLSRFSASDQRRTIPMVVVEFENEKKKYLSPRHGGLRVGGPPSVGGTTTHDMGI